MCVREGCIHEIGSVCVVVFARRGDDIVSSGHRQHRERHRQQRASSAAGEASSAAGIVCSGRGIVSSGHRLQRERHRQQWQRHRQQRERQPAACSTATLSSHERAQQLR
eukprot:366108-Chlamydomonas_euryale.AAC.4